MEYITGGGMRQEAIPPSLAREGELMLGALVGDLLNLTLVLELIVLRDDRLEPHRYDHLVQTVIIGDTDSFQSIWEQSVNQCDAVWPIAPENDGILEQLCMDVEKAGKALLNCPSVAVRLAASKLATARRLAESGLPVVDTVALDKGLLPISVAVVVKPDDGVGCEGAVIIRDHRQLLAFMPSKGWIVQPLLKGDALSLSVLCAAGRARLLSCNRQQIEWVGDGFSLTGVVVNAIADVNGAWQLLAENIACAMPELWGYVGIDLMLTETGPVILEVNPRLTTSYAGLRVATGNNPAGLVLNLYRTGQLPTCYMQTPKPIEINLG